MRYKNTKSTKRHSLGHAISNRLHSVYDAQRQENLHMNIPTIKEQNFTIAYVSVPISLRPRPSTERADTP